MEREARAGRGLLSHQVFEALVRNEMRKQEKRKRTAMGSNVLNGATQSQSHSHHTAEWLMRFRKVLIAATRDVMCVGEKGGRSI